MKKLAILAALVLTTGVSAYGVAHAAHNAGEAPVRFLIGGQPGTIASYLAQFDEMRSLPCAHGQIA